MWGITGCTCPGIWRSKPVFITDRGRMAYAVLKIDHYYSITGHDDALLPDVMDSIPGADSIEFEPPPLHVKVGTAEFAQGAIKMYVLDILQCHGQADLGAELEAVDHRLGDAVGANRCALLRHGLDACGIGLTSQPGQGYRRIGSVVPSSITA